jgi:hypothetical protein
MAERGCNVARLGSDILHWDEDIRRRWCFDYYRVEPPARGLGDQTVTEEIEE